MQLNNLKSSTSNIIKQSEIAKKKARRRLIGSIFMLFTALIILLNVTTKVKPIAISPKVIEISNDASAPVKKVAAASAPAQIAKISSAPATITASEPVNTTIAANTSTNSSTQNTGFKAGVVTNSQEQPSTQTPQAVVTQPKIISQTIGHKPSPEDILNGNTSGSVATVYFIQIAASQNKEALQTIQQNLSKQGIKAFILSTTKNNIFRLRVGPFKDKDAANEKLEQIQSNLKQ